MIAKLTGIIDSVGADFAVIDVAGVGYMVFASSRTLGRLLPGDAASLLVETHVREDHIHLFGFYDALERDWFKLLTTVQGVGPKVCLAILSVLDPDGLVHAVAAGDKAAVARANGVGPKLAGRIVSELKDKVGALALGAAPAPAEGTPKGKGKSKSKGTGKAKKPGKKKEEAGPDTRTLTHDAVSALVNLGYGPSEALVAVSHAAHAMEDAVTVEALIKAGLGELGGAEGAR